LLNLGKLPLRFVYDVLLSVHRGGNGALHIEQELIVLISNFVNEELDAEKGFLKRLCFTGTYLAKAFWNMTIMNGFLNDLRLEYEEAVLH
jgi:hypothetical protein